MRIGKYKINFSERGKHYGELLGGWLAIAIIIISLSAIGTWIFSTADMETLKVTHVYEDNCIDLYNTETEEYYFYCEDITFYGEN